MGTADPCGSLVGMRKVRKGRRSEGDVSVAGVNGTVLYFNRNISTLCNILFTEP